MVIITLLTVVSHTVATAAGPAATVQFTILLLSLPSSMNFFYYLAGNRKTLLLNKITLLLPVFLLFAAT